VRRAVNKRCFTACFCAASLCCVVRGLRVPGSPRFCSFPLHFAVRAALGVGSGMGGLLPLLFSTCLFSLLCTFRHCCVPVLRRHYIPGRLLCLLTRGDAALRRRGLSAWRRPLCGAGASAPARCRPPSPSRAFRVCCFAGAVSVRSRAVEDDAWLMLSAMSHRGTRRVLLAVQTLTPPPPPAACVQRRSWKLAYRYWAFMLACLFFCCHISPHTPGVVGAATSLARRNKRRAAAAWRGAAKKEKGEQRRRVFSG